MNQRTQERTHQRPLRTALVTSAAALLVAFGGSAAFADDDDDDDRRHDRRGRYSRDHRDHGRDHYRGDRGRDHRRYDRGDRDRDRGDYRRGDRYSDRRYRAPHRYPGRDQRSYYRDHRGYRDHRNYRYDRSYRGRYDHRRFNVPRHIYRRHYGDYGSYYRGSVFYGPHRHHHRVYYFPVYIDGFVQYQPHAYCGDAFYPDHYGHDGVRGHLGLHFNF